MPKPATRISTSNVKAKTSNIPEASLSDVVSIDAIVTAAYEVISGPAGKKRDWNRERSLFLSGARLIPTAVEAGRNDVDLAPQMLDVEGYIARVEPLIEKKGFYEKEIARRVEQFGQIAHVWSTYESRHDPSDPKPFMRGINSMQLFNDGKRWWIVSIYWQHESAQHSLPEKYL
jgi:hypothetical protein